MLKKYKNKKIVIFGLGSIGSRHAKIIRDNSSYELFAFRSSKLAKKNSLGITELFSWQELFAVRPDIALISNPTNQHVKTALKCAELGMHLFIEKPLSHDVKGIAELKKISKRNNLTVYVAYCLRFHPVIKKIRELLINTKIFHVRAVCASYLPDWREKEAYSSYKAQGGGVLLDLSHELDYISYLFGKTIKLSGTFGRKSNITRDSEDFADLFFSTEKGITVNIHLDYFSQKKERTLKVVFHNGYLIGDLLANTIEYVYDKKKKLIKFSSNRNDYLRDQFDYFVDHIGKRSIMNNLGEAAGLLNNIVELKNG